MCGILGTINLPIDTSALDLLRHRGPDGEGLTEFECGRHQVTLGHRRLAIVDLSSHGAQPMSTSDDAQHIVFNGEIYNHQDIRPELPDCEFHGHSDTETLLQTLASYGIAGLTKLNGIFGLGYLDLANHRLFLARDPFGVKPVYYSIQPQQMCFASEIAPLRAITDISVDDLGLSALLKLRFVPSPRTLYSGIRRLRPGHVLEIDLGSDTLSWRDYPFISASKTTNHRRPGFEAVLDEYGRLFDQAVSRQLMADVEVGILLSGGIDSALVASSAQRAAKHPLKAFTVGFKDTNAGNIDEIDAAAEMAELLGMEHFTKRIGFDDFLDVLRECVQIVEEPLATTSIIPMHFLSKLAGDHVKVVMSGQGADELLGGYNRYQVELWRRFVPPIFAKAGSEVARILGVKNDMVRRGLRALRERDDVPRFLEAYSVFSDDEILSLTGIAAGAARDDIDYFYELLECEALPSSVERMMSIDTRLGLSDDLLLYTDKISMRESLECRVPFLDLDLVAFIQSLPHNYRLKLGKTKIIHKAYARRTLPPSIVNRPKRGFLSPTKDWFKNEEVLRSLLLDRSSQFAEHLDLSGVETVIKQHQRGFDRERQIFVLLCLYFCLEATK